MEDILSEIDNTKNKKPAVFSKIAFGFAILTIILFATLFVNFMLIITARGGNPAISMPAAGMLLFSMLGGLVLSIISLVKKEKIKYIKTIAAILNIGLFALILGLMIYSMMSDWDKMKQS